MDVVSCRVTQTLNRFGGRLKEAVGNGRKVRRGDSVTGATAGVA